MAVLCSLRAGSSPPGVEAATHPSREIWGCGPHESGRPAVLHFFLFFLYHGLQNYDEDYNLLTQAHSNLHVIMLYCIGNDIFLIQTNEYIL